MAGTPPRLGTVTAFDEALGYGSVLSEAVELFFHCTQIADGTRAIEVGARVAFSVGPGAPGRWEAFGLVKLALT
jgi:cold shock CspA family protein